MPLLCCAGRAIIRYAINIFTDDDDAAQTRLANHTHHIRPFSVPGRATRERRPRRTNKFRY